MKQELKVGLSPSEIFFFCFFFSDSLSKMMKKAFFLKKAPLILKIFIFFVLTFWSFRKNNLITKIRKDQVNFEIYSVTGWITNNCNTLIAQYLKNSSQLDNEIWSVNRIWHEIWSFLKIIQKWEREARSRPCFDLFFFKKALYKVILYIFQKAISLSLKYFQKREELYENDKKLWR